MFKKAVRSKIKLKIALTGPSGSGKTYSGLVLAKSLGKKIAVIDTENESSSLYSDRFDFDVCSLKPPYLVTKYVDAINEAIKAGYDIVLVDSITHAWAGEGGILERKTALDMRGGNSFTNWGKLTPEHEKLKSVILNADVHMICTMRSKQDYVLELNNRGKQAPKKVGMAPIQRDGMEYEFTTVFDIAMDHTAATSKDRTNQFDGFLSKIDESTGEIFKKWLSTAHEVQTEPTPAIKPKPQLFNAGSSENKIIQNKKVAPEPQISSQSNKTSSDNISKKASTEENIPPQKYDKKPITAEQIKRLFTIATAQKWDYDQVKMALKKTWGHDSSKDLLQGQYEWFCNKMEEMDLEKYMQLVKSR